MGLAHIVITSVDRDDLPDGGAGQFVRVIEELRARSPETTIEILTPDFRNKEGALEPVVVAKPDVFNHNLETVPRLYPTIRPDCPAPSTPKSRPMWQRHARKWGWPISSSPR